MAERIVSLDQTFPIFSNSTHPISWHGVAALADTVRLKVPAEFGGGLVSLTSIAHDNWAPEDDSAYDGENLFVTPWKPELGYTLSEADAEGVLSRVRKLKGFPAGDLAKYQIQTNANRPTGHDSNLKVVTLDREIDRNLLQSGWWSKLKFQLDFDPQTVTLPYYQFESRVDLNHFLARGNVHFEFYPTKLGPLASARCPEFEDICVLLKEGIQFRVPFNQSKLGTLQGRYL